MKEAIKTEKSILRFRLTQIRNWALKRLRHQRQQALNVYGKIDDLIWDNYNFKGLFNSALSGYDFDKIIFYLL